MIRIGTRSSKLALWQAYYIQDKLEAQGLQTELVTFETKGDKILDRALSKIGSKGLFTEELEQALHDGTIDIAVHSAKDMPSTLPEGLPLIAFTEREIACDVLVSKNKNLDLSANPVIGTSSTRRVALLKHYYPNVGVTNMRGNLQTRFKKMEDGVCDALLLAYAGVHRMEMDEYIVHKFPLDQFTPPVGQGTVAVQACPAQLGEEKVNIIRECCNHSETETRLLAERAFLKTLEGGCSVPVFAMATLEENQVSISGGIVSLDGKTLLKEVAQGPSSQAASLGEELAKSLLSQGGDKMLEEIKKQL